MLQELMTPSMLGATQTREMAARIPSARKKGSGGWSGCSRLQVPLAATDDGLPSGVRSAGRPYENELLLDLAVRAEESFRLARDWRD